MKAAIASVALIAAGLAAWSAAPAQTHEKISRVIIYGRDPCPRGPDGEIVICGRRPERERYRIPEALRNAPATDTENMSWAVKAESLEYVGHTGIQSCSTVGPGGSTGCWTQLMQQARKERAQPQ